MDFKNFIGQKFYENEFYEILLFEIEQKREQYFSKFIHFYFDRTDDKRIHITELAYFKDATEMDQKSRSMIEKKEWFEVYDNHGHIDLLLCRFDRTGMRSVVYEDKTRTEDWGVGWADETPHTPMTRDEIREAFKELAGVFQNQQDLQKLRSKKAV